MVFMREGRDCMPAPCMCMLSLAADLCSRGYMKVRDCCHKTGNGCSSGRKSLGSARTRCIPGARSPAKEEESSSCNKSGR